MDGALVAQIVFANEIAFKGINDSKKCQMIYKVCKAVKENQHISDVISKNRAELYAINIFNCLYQKSKNIQSVEEKQSEDNTKEFGVKITKEIMIMLNKQSEKFLCYFVDYIISDYTETLINCWQYNNGLGNIYNNKQHISFILYNYKMIVNILGINCCINLEQSIICAKYKKIIKTRQSQGWLIDDILKMHNEINID
jgi:hypothetical protein